MGNTKVRKIFYCEKYVNEKIYKLKNIQMIKYLYKNIYIFSFIHS